MMAALIGGPGLKEVGSCQGPGQVGQNPDDSTSQQPLPVSKPQIRWGVASKKGSG